MQVVVPNYVPDVRPVKVAFVGEAPGAYEVARGQPFVGPAGRELDTWMRGIFVRSRCFIGNLCQTRAPGDRIEAVPQQELDRWVEVLRQQLQELRPNLVVALGNYPLKYLTGKEGILRWWGSVIPCTLVPGLKVMALPHPSFVLRGKVAARPIIRVWMQRAKEEAETPELRLPQRELVIDPSYEQVMAELERLQDAPVLALDIETGRARVVRNGPGGLIYNPPVITCIALSDSPHWAICIPFARGGQPRWHASREAEIWRALSRLLAKPGTLKVAHNLMYDLLVLGAYGIYIAPPYYDTMVAHNRAYLDFSRDDLRDLALNRLSFCAALYTREQFWKCLQPDVEVLTPDGWRRICDVQVGQPVMACRDGRLGWEPVVAVHSYDFDGFGIRIHGKRHNTWYTPDHRVVRADGSLVEARDCRPSARLKVAGWYSGPGNATVPPDGRLGPWILQLDGEALDKLVGDGATYDSVDEAWWAATAAHLRGRLSKVVVRGGRARVYVGRKDYVPVSNFTPEPYKGKVWCITVESGAFLARSNGHIFITGNSDHKAENKPDADWRGPDHLFWTYNAKDAVILHELVEATRRDLEAIGGFELFRMDMKVLEVLASMAMTGVRRDQVALRQLNDEVLSVIDRLQNEVDAAAGRPLNTKSSKQMCQFLYVDLELPIQCNRKTGRPTADESAIAKLYAKTKLPILATIKRLNRLRTFHQNYLRQAVSLDGRSRTVYNQCTSTCRVSSSTPFIGEGSNLQVVPSHERPGEDHYNAVIKAYKRTFLPDEGKLLWRLDYEQAEARVVAWLSRDIQTMSDFENGIDIHLRTVEILLDRPYDWLRERYVDGDPEIKLWRNIGKRVRHASNYRMGPKELQTQLTKADIDIDLKDCKRCLEALVSNIPALVRWHAEVEEQLRTERAVTNCFGRTRVFFGPITDDTVREAIAYGPQSTVADMLNFSLVRIYESGLLEDGADLLLQLHDAVIGQSPPDKLRAHVEQVAELMRLPVEVHKRTLVIPTDISVGPSWGELRSPEWAGKSRTG